MIEITVEVPFDKLCRRIDKRTVKRPDGCWTYNNLSYRPRMTAYIEGRQVGFIVSRIVLSRKLDRELLDGLDALHTCDNEWCINPDHLYEGTQKENSNEYWKKFRTTAYDTPIDVETRQVMFLLHLVGDWDYTDGKYLGVHN